MPSPTTKPVLARLKNCLRSSPSIGIAASKSDHMPGPVMPRGLRQEEAEAEGRWVGRRPERSQALDVERGSFRCGSPFAVVGLGRSDPGAGIRVRTDAPGGVTADERDDEDAP